MTNKLKTLRKIDDFKRCPMCGDEVYPSRDQVANVYWMDCQCGLSTKPYKTLDNLYQFWNTRVDADN